MTYRSVDAYVSDLAHRLRVGRRTRRRIEQEVAAHLADLVAEEEATGMTPQAAARRASERFGQPEALAAEFNRNAAEHLLRRASWALAGCAAVAFVAAGVWVRDGGALTAWPDDLLFGLTTQVLVQVAGVCALIGLFLAVVAPWIRHVPLAGAGARRAGRSMVLAAAALLPVAVVAAGNVARTTAPLERALLVLVAVTVPLASGWAWLAASRADLLEGEGDATTLDAVVECCEALLIRTAWSARGYQHAAVLWARCEERAPGGISWFQLRRHPWRAALSLSIAAGVALKMPDLLIKGEVDLPAAGIEAAAVFLSYCLLGGLLGLRAPRPAEPTRPGLAG
jgi:hypothetical protein